MRSNILLGEDTIEDIYERNYGSGGFDHVEFGRIVAEIQLEHACNEIKKAPLIRIGSKHWANPDIAAREQRESILRLLGDV